jgi:Holliday junction resolvase RusA-like endonuclease
VIRFFVPGEPKALSVATTVHWRSKDGRSGSFQQRRHESWAELIGRVGLDHRPPQPELGGVRLELSFLLPRPMSTPKKVTLPLKRPDVDNLFHKLSDRWNGVFWRDDSQIVELRVLKRFTRDGRTGVWVSIGPVLQAGQLAIAEDTQ